MNGDCTSPSLVNWTISVWFRSLYLIQWNLRPSRSSALILVWRNDFWRSRHRAIGLNLVLMSTLHSTFWRAGPVSKQSFIEKLLLFSLADASYTISSFVILAFSQIAALCSKYNSCWPKFASSVTFSTTPSVNCSCITWSYISNSF